MTITPKDISTLKAMYLKRYGVSLSDEETIGLGNRLLNLIGPMVEQLAIDLEKDSSNYERRQHGKSDNL